MEEMPRKSAAELEAECLRLLAMDPHTRGIKRVEIIRMYFVAHEFDDAAAFMDRGLTVNPNFALAWMLSAWLRVWRSQPDLALEHVARAMTPKTATGSTGSGPKTESPEK
jgi:Tfp pilus assembly protein PilF